MNPAVVILAAGKGVRMRSPLPKVLHRLCGRPVLSWVVETAASLEPARTVIVAGTFIAEIRAAVDRPGVEYAVQEKPLGTAHAASVGMEALGGFDGTVVVLPGDTPLVTGELLKALVGAHESGRREATVLTFTPQSAGAYGRVIRAADGSVARIVEARDATPEEAAVREVNSGMYCFSGRALARALKTVKTDNAQGEYYLTDVVAALPRGSVGALEARDPWDVAGINTRIELAQAAAVMRSRLIGAIMESGVEVVDPSSAYVESGVEVGEGTVLHPFVVIRRGAKIGRGCSIGPFAHVREGSTIGDGAVVGDFVEIKSSSLGEGSAARHLAYIGDARVGRDVNIGAGVITANFDGSKKNVTVVGDGARLGSGTILVAPVRIGEGATTGAGSVVLKNRDVAPGETVAGVPAQALGTRRVGPSAGSAARSTEDRGKA